MLSIFKREELVPDEDGCMVNDSDTAWVLVATILVLGMMPALAFFEGGLLRSKNTLSFITQIFSGIVALGFLWDIFGYSLVFGTDHGGVIGSYEHFLLLGVDYWKCSPHAPYIPAACFALFQMMFATITPLLMTGAYAERIKWKSAFFLTVMWEIFIFYPVAHWIWGGGWLQKMDVLDFAGGIVIHTSAGAGSLVIALMLGRRKHFNKYHGEFPPSNLPMAALGAALLWMGWFGFNAGSALRAGSVAVSAVASTQIAACSSGIVWLFISWAKNKPSTVALLNGVIAGLAGITPASGYVDSQASIIIGLILGFGSYFSVWLLKHKLRIDDALDVSSVHGVTGVIGSIAIGFCAQKSLNPDGFDGVIYGNPRQLGVQTLAVVVVAAYAGVGTFIICWIIDKTFGLKISPEKEEEGLDITEHKEFAYHNLMLTGHELYDDLEEIGSDDEGHPHESHLSAAMRLPNRIMHSFKFGKRDKHYSKISFDGSYPINNNSETDS